MYRARQALAVIAWVLIGAVLVQVFLAGTGIFGASGMDLHIGFGHLLTLVPILMLVLAWPARPGRTIVLLLAVLLVLLIVQSVLPILQGAAPSVAALHMPNALLVFGLALMVARRTTLLLRTERMVSVEEDAESVEPAPVDSA